MSQERNKSAPSIKKNLEVDYLFIHFLIGTFPIDTLFSLSFSHFAPVFSKLHIFPLSTKSGWLPFISKNLWSFKFVKLKREGKYLPSGYSTSGAQLWAIKETD